MTPEEELGYQSGRRCALPAGISPREARKVLDNISVVTEYAESTFGRILAPCTRLNELDRM